MSDSPPPWPPPPPRPPDAPRVPPTSAAEPAPGPCVHGGGFFEAVGEAFDDLRRHEQVINADVLDAWFPPSPRALEALRAHLDWLVRTSPPTHAEGLVRTLARVRGVPEASLLTAAGSSDLIFLCLREWLSPASRALVLDPTYGEYEHVLRHVVGCRVDRLRLREEDGYDLRPEAFEEATTATAYDLVVLVNPNSPTGRHVPRRTLERLLLGLSERTRVWVDETYVDYAGSSESLERFAATRPNVVVCKSMSKAYALSGVRVAYLCTAPSILAGLRALTPPWAVSLPAQVAAVKALEDPAWYEARWHETAALRETLAAALRDRLGFSVVPSTTNFLLCRMPDGAPTTAELGERVRPAGLFLRDVSGMGSGLPPRAVRLAVKDAATNARMVDLLAGALRR